MAIQPIRSCEIVGTESGNSPKMVELPENALETFKVGMPVMTDVDGHVTACVAPGNALTTQRVMGIAMTAGQNKSADALVNTRIALANEDTLFALSVYHSTDESAVTSKDLVGRNLGLYVDADGKLRADISTLANQNAKVKCIGLHPGDAVGDKYGRVVVRFGMTSRIKVVPVTVSSGSTTGSSLEDDPDLLGAVILGYYPTGNQDQLVDKVEIDTTNKRAKVTLVAAASADSSFNVVVLV